MSLRTPRGTQEVELRLGTTANALTGTFDGTAIEQGLVEVPIVKTIATWTVETLPDDWRRHRDRWVSFHAVRVVTGLAALTCSPPCQVEAVIPVRCAASVEATACFVVAEALTNITKHSRAGNAAVKVRRTGDRLHVRITDDGRGGADEHSGSGLVGIRRRIEAHDGTFTLTSSAGEPTSLTVSLPCGS